MMNSKHIDPLGEYPFWHSTAWTRLREARAAEKCKPTDYREAIRELERMEGLPWWHWEAVQLRFWRRTSRLRRIYRDRFDR
jgi:hypothetical protein